MNVPLPAVGRSRGASGAGGQGGTAEGSSFLSHRFRPHLSNTLKKYFRTRKTPAHRITNAAKREPREASGPISAHQSYFHSSTNTN